MQEIKSMAIKIDWEDETGHIDQKTRDRIFPKVKSKFKKIKINYMLIKREREKDN